MSKNLATPGVYVEEKNAFPNSVAGIPTAVPAFVGYTGITRRDGMPLVGKPVRINSLTEYHNIFGGGVKATFNIKPTSEDDVAAIEVAGKTYKVEQDSASRFIMYDSIRLFFANGGSTCWIVSAGGYYQTDGLPTKKPVAKEKEDKDGKTPVPAPAPAPEIVPLRNISKKDLLDAVAALIAEEEPTMLIVPEAVMLEEGDCFALQQEMLVHCGYKMKNRFAIIDVINGTRSRSHDKNDVINRFREGIGSNFLAYGAAYFPWVYTSIVDSEEVDFRNISNLDTLEDLLSKEADFTAPNPKKADEIKTEIRKIGSKDANVARLTQTLNVISPAFKKIMQTIRTHLNILPPSAAMAGIYSTIDSERGVWKAPANVSVNSVISPVVKITHDDQEDLNVTVTGKSINAIRSFVGEGTTVWGARTMDGNSQDWRYINVRRTVTYIEQSIKYMAKKYVYEPNTSGTWVLIRSSISSFLNDIWRQGGLVGLTPAEAFEVQIGLGTTMTPTDILDGVMRITVKVAVSRPAEFIVITFQQKVQES